MPVARATPPEEALYQSAVSPVPTVTLKAGIVSPWHIVREVPTGGFTNGQAQTGEVTTNRTTQPGVLVAVKVTFVPTGTPVTVLPLIVPAEAVTVPFDVNVTEYVSKSTAQTGLPTKLKVGNGFTVKVTAVRVDDLHPFVVLRVSA